MEAILSIITRRPLLVLGITLVAIMIPVIYFLLAVKGKTEVTFILAPKDAILRLNGDEIKAGTHRLEPGRYRIAASRSGFKAFSQIVTVGEESMNVPVALEPVTEEAFDIAKRDNSEYLETEAEGARIAQEKGDKFRTENPIVRKLPYSTLFYRIDYRLKSPNSPDIILEIRAKSSTDRNYALAQIKNWGFNPANYQIDYLPWED